MLAGDPGRAARWSTGSRADLQREGSGTNWKRALHDGSGTNWKRALHDTPSGDAPLFLSVGVMRLYTVVAHGSTQGPDKAPCQHDEM